MIEIKSLLSTIFLKNARKKRNKPTDELAILDGFTNPTKLIDKKHIEAIVAYAEKL